MLKHTTELLLSTPLFSVSFVLFCILAGVLGPRHRQVSPRGLSWVAVCTLGLDGARQPQYAGRVKQDVICFQVYESGWKEVEKFEKLYISGRDCGLVGSWRQGSQKLGLWLLDCRMILYERERWT